MDYSDYKQTPTGDLAAVSKLAEDLREAQTQVEILMEALEVAQKRVTDIAEHQLPELMDAVGLETISTQSGLVVQLKNTVRASIPAARREEAMRWLEDTGHGAMIKREVSVAFGRDQESQAKELVRELGDEYDVKTDCRVESSTLRAWVAEQLESGHEVPQDLFGVFQQRQAKVSLPKETRKKKPLDSDN